MKSCSCYEGILKVKMEKHGKTGCIPNRGRIGDSDAKDVIINILVPLSDKKNVENIKVVAMDRGESRSKEINAADLLRNSSGDTIKFSFNFDRKTEIGQIQKGDMYFACVSSNELNSPKGTECEHKLTKTIGRENNMYAR